MATWCARFQRLVRARGSLLRDAVAAASIVVASSCWVIDLPRAVRVGVDLPRGDDGAFDEKRSSAPAAESQAVQSLEGSDGRKRDERLDPAASASSTIISTDGSRVIRRGQPCASTDLLV
jgi:hypothetical protein